MGERDDAAEGEKWIVPPGDETLNRRSHILYIHTLHI